MSDILDYLRAQGQLTLDELPFCEADNLAFCQVSYLDLASAATGAPDQAPTLGEVWDAFQATRSREELYLTTVGSSELTPFILAEMARSPRFGHARLLSFRERLDPKEHEQFAAMGFSLDDGSALVVFRGTDNTIAGWREDFMISYEVVPAQRDAVRYLEWVCEHTSGPVRVAGHSKGGNLAAYAAAFLPEEHAGRICEVWCDDSPGFERRVVDFSRLEAIAGRTTLLTPEFCVVGSLLEHVVPARRVVSTNEHFMQHALPSWEVTGTLASRSPSTGSPAAGVQALFRELVESRDLADRRAFVRDVFDALESTGATTLPELVSQGADGIERVVRALGSYDERTTDTVRDLLLALAGDTLGSMVGMGREPAPEEPDSEPTIEGMRRLRRRRSRAKSRRLPIDVLRTIMGSNLVRNSVLLVVGLVTMANADVGGPILGYVVVILLGAFALYLLVRYQAARAAGEPPDREDLLLGAGVGVCVALVLVFRVSLNVLYNLVLGAGLGIFGLKTARDVYRETHAIRGLIRQPWGVFSLLCVAEAAVLVVNPTQLEDYALLSAGSLVTLLAIYGIIASGADR